MEHVSKNVKHLPALLAVTATLAIPFAAEAHDPREHLKDAESPNCIAMRDMEHGKMDADDPVMQAMMKQCMDELHHDDEQGDAPEEAEPPESRGSDSKHSVHQH